MKISFRQILAALALSMAMVLPVSAADSDSDSTLYLIYVNAQVAPLFSVPSDQAMPFTSVNQGERFPFIKDTKVNKQLWYQIMLRDGTKAWIRSENGVKITSDQPPPTPPTPAPPPTPVPYSTPAAPHTPAQVPAVSYVMESKTVIVVEVERALVHGEPSANSPLLGEANPGQKFDLVKRYEEWYQISFAGRDGYIQAKDVSERVETIIATTPVKQVPAPAPEPMRRTQAAKSCKPKNKVGFFAEFDLGSTLFDIYGSWKTWADSETTTEGFSARPSPIFDLFFGYHQKNWAIGPEMAYTEGRFKFGPSGVKNFQTFHIGPRLRFLFNSPPTRPYLDLILGYAYSEAGAAGMGDEDNIEFDLYNIGMAGGVVHQATDSFGFGFNVRAEFFGPIKKATVVDMGDIEIKATYGWFPVSLNLFVIFRR